MASQLKTLYEELGRAFFSKPSDLKKCAVVLSKLKVCFLLTSFTSFCSFSQDRAHRGWLTSPSRRRKSWRPCRRSFVSKLNYCCLLILRISGDILEIGAFCSIRSRDVPSFDRYFSQLQTFYTDYRSVIQMKCHFDISICLKRIPPSFETGIRHSRP